MKKRSVGASLAMVIVMLLLSWLVPFRIMLWICLLLPVPLIIGIAVIVGSKKTKRRNTCFSVLITVIGACVLYCFFGGWGRYAFVSGAFIPFWPIPLVISLIVSVFVAIKMLRGKCGVWWSILGLLLCGIVAFGVLNTYAAHLNYLLDFSEPQGYTATIEQKDFDLHRKGPDTYEFKITVDGQTLWLEVSQSDYYGYEVGDAFTFTRYNGAFGEAFYVS